MFRGRLTFRMLGFAPFGADQKIGISSVVRPLGTVRVRVRDSDQKPKITEEKYGRGVSLSNLARLALFRGGVTGSCGATIGKDFVPKLGDAPCSREDDAFSYENTENISRN